MQELQRTKVQYVKLRPYYEPPLMKFYKFSISSWKITFTSVDSVFVSKLTMTKCPLIDKDILLILWIKTRKGKHISPGPLIRNSVPFLGHNWTQPHHNFLWTRQRSPEGFWPILLLQIVPAGKNCVVSKHWHSLWVSATDCQYDLGLGFAQATPLPWLWYPSGTAGLISKYALGHCLDDIQLDWGI